jgi:hypothetical protein
VDELVRSGDELLSVLEIADVNELTQRSVCNLIGEGPFPAGASGDALGDETLGPR